MKSSQTKTLVTQTPTVNPQNEELVKTINSYLDRAKTRDEILAALAALQSKLTKTG